MVMKCFEGVDSPDGRWRIGGQILKDCDISSVFEEESRRRTEYGWDSDLSAQKGIRHARKKTARL
jgi:hypothetical protein